MRRAASFVALACVTAAALAASTGGMKCDMWGTPPDPALVKPRPIILELVAKDGTRQKFDIPAELVTRIVDEQTPEFLFSRFYGSGVLRPKEAPADARLPKT